MITIHEKTAQKFDTLGLGALLPSSCVVTEEINGAYELKMKHPYDEHGKWKRIERGRIITASTPRGVQYFRIYNTKPNMDSIEVNARHVFYDLLDNQCSEISYNGAASGALAALQGSFAFAMPFSFTTDISVSGELKTARMNPVQVLLTDDDEATSFVKGFGGELLRDGFKVSILSAMGKDRDVAIRYGKNLVGLDVTEDESDVKTRIQYHGSDGSGTMDSPFIHEYVYPKIHPLEDENKTKAELKAEGQALFDGGIDLPLVNIKVDFIVLADTVEYADYAPLEEVFLGDIVTIINQKMNFSKKARVISYEWDCLLERYNEVELGDFMPTLAASVTSGVRSGSLASSAAVGTSAVSAALQAHLNDFNNPHKTKTGGDSSLPTVTVDDDGKVLMVDEGAWTAQELGKYLGEYEVTPSTEKIVLSTAKLLMSGDVTIKAIPQSILDEEYQNGYDEAFEEWKPFKHKLDWIQTNGTQSIDVGFAPNQDTRIVMDATPLNVSSANGIFFGSAYPVQQSGFEAYIFNGLFYVVYNGVQKNGTAAFSADQRVTVDFNKNTCTVKREGETVYSETFTYAKFTSPKNLNLFALPRSGKYYGIIKLHSCQVYDNGILIRDYIPVLDWDDGPCLYDKVGRKLYYSVETEEFIAGPIAA